MFQYFLLVVDTLAVSVRYNQEKSKSIINENEENKERRNEDPLE